MADSYLRPLRPTDMDALVRMTSATGVFRPDEVEIARGVLTDALARGAASDYMAWVAVDGDRPVGYVAFGPTPLTVGTWDVHWIAVEPGRQRQRTGARLMAAVEEEACRRQARQVLAEMSGGTLYEQARRFFLRLGYTEISRIPDFYDVGEPRVTYAKTLDCGKTAR